MFMSVSQWVSRAFGSCCIWKSHVMNAVASGVKDLTKQWLVILTGHVWTGMRWAKELTREVGPKGQLISKCPFGIIVWTKNQCNYFWISALNFFCSFLGASWKLFGLPGDIVSNIINKEAYRKPPKASRKPQGSYKKFQGRNPEIFRWFFGRSFPTKRTFWN